MKTLFIVISLLLASNCFASVDTTQVYHSGLLVFLFLGFCSMIVIAQLIPAIIMLVGTIKGVFNKEQKVLAK